MTDRVDHTWEMPLNIYAHLGPPGDVRCYEVFGGDPLACAVSAHIAALSRNHVPGQKFVLGPLWVKRIRENADAISQAADALE